MNRKLIACAALVALFALPALAEDAKTLEEVLAMHHDAIGGVDAWTNWETARMTGTMKAGGGQMEAPFVITFANAVPAKSRMEFTFQGMTGIQAYDGSDAWMVMPFMGNPNPEPMPADQAKLMRENSDLAGPLVNSEKKGAEVEYLGVEEVEGTPAHKLQVTLEDGERRTYYLDTDYGLPFKVEAKIMQQDQEVDVETTLGDYKEVDGRVFAHSMASRPKNAPEGAGQTIVIETAEFGVEVAEDYFKMPAKEGAATDG